MLVGSASLGAVGLAACTTDESWSGQAAGDGRASAPPNGEPVADLTPGGRPSEIDGVLSDTTLLALGNGRVLRLGAAADTVTLVDNGAPLWTAGGTGSEPGRFQLIGGAALGPDGSFWIVDTGNRRVQVLSATGELAKVVGAPEAAAVPLRRPAAVAVAPDGRAFVADAGRSGVVPFSADGVAGELIGGFGSDRPFVGIIALEVVADELVVVEALAPRVQVRDLDGAWLRTIDLPAHFTTVDIAVDGDQVYLVSHDGRLARTRLDGSTDAEGLEVLGHVGGTARGLHLGPDGLIVAARPLAIGSLQ